MQVYTHPTYAGTSICPPKAEITSLPTPIPTPIRTHQHPQASSSYASSSSSSTAATGPPPTHFHRPSSHPDQPISTSYPSYLQNNPYPQQLYSYAHQPMSNGYGMMVLPTHFPSGTRMRERKETKVILLLIYISTLPCRYSPTNMTRFLYPYQYALLFRPTNFIPINPPYPNTISTHSSTQHLNPPHQHILTGLSAAHAAAAYYHNQHQQQQQQQQQQPHDTYTPHPLTPVLHSSSTATAVAQELPSDPSAK